MAATDVFERHPPKGVTTVAPPLMLIPASPVLHERVIFHHPKISRAAAERARPGQARSIILTVPGSPGGPIRGLVHPASFSHRPPSW